jgi:hypothetical protein
LSVIKVTPCRLPKVLIWSRQAEIFKDPKPNAEEEFGTLGLWPEAAPDTLVEMMGRRLIK